MSKMFFKMGIGLLALIGIAWPAVAAPPMVKLHGHVPPVVSKLTPVGQMPSTNVLHLAIGLPLHNQDILSALTAQIYNPSSQNYHHFLTPQEFTAQFGPTPEDYQAVLDFAKTNGLTLTRKHANRMLVEVSGNASDVERAFDIHLHTYQHPTENRQFFAPDTEPSVPATMRILDIQGLANYVRPHPKMHINNIKTSTKLGSGSGGSYMGYDFRNAYTPGTTLTGTGQKVALYEWDGYLASDIAAYVQKAGLPAVALTNVLLEGFSGIPINSLGQGEVTLDIDMANAMAPGLSQIIVYEASPQLTSQNTILNQIAEDNLAHQISCSWGWGGGPSGTTDQIFQEMILQGQSFFNASGDSCAFLPAGSSGNASGSVDDSDSGNAPSDSPYITQVGATTLQTTGPGGSYVSESVWNWGIEFPRQGLDGIGSSGGISGFYAIPTWQQGISMTSSKGSTVFRNTPDVSLTGDNIFIIENGADQLGVAGTSCAAPLWAGVTALINQQAVINGKPVVGFLNPALYSLAKTAAYTTVFNDVVNGNNTWSQSPANFFAVAGYDLATGLGTPNGTALINALASGNISAGPVISAPKGPASGTSWGNTLSVMNDENPNGPWFLFIQDDKVHDIGIINNGWSVALTTANPVGYAADNQIYLTANAANGSPGLYWTNVLSVTNYGPSFSTNVYVTDILPPSNAGVMLSSYAAAGSVSIFGDNLTWTIGNLTTNAGASLTLSFYANSNAFGLYTNSAHVHATTSDPNPDDDTAGATLQVISLTPPQVTPSFNGATKGFKLTVTGGSSGQSAVIQASTNLVNWVPIYTNLVPFVFTNFDSTNFPMRFYRATIGP